MATTTLNAGTETAITFTGLNSLANATYAVSSAVDVSAIDPVDLAIRLSVTPGTGATGAACYVYLKTSFDNTSWTTGPESGTSAVNAGNLLRLGTLYLETTSSLQSKTFDVMSALGFVPPYFKIVVKNATGSAFAGSGNSANYTPYSAVTV